VKDENPHWIEPEECTHFGQGRNTRNYRPRVPNRQKSNLTPKKSFIGAPKTTFWSMITIHGARYLGIHNGMSAMKITHRGTLGLGELFSVTMGNDLRQPRREVLALRGDLMPARRMFSLSAHL
jgi:hypothetical protein